MDKSTSIIPVLTNLSGFTCATQMVINQIAFGWMTPISITASAPIYFGHNIFDLIIGRIPEKDIFGTIHHIVSIILGYYYLKNMNSLNQNHINFTKYLVLSEISSIFNNGRYFLYNTAYRDHSKILFGLSFLIVRPISIAGSGYYLLQLYKQNDFSLKYFLPLWSSLAFLNTYWCYLVVKKFKDWFSYKNKSEIILKST